MPKLIPQNVKDEAIYLRKSGESLREIAKHLKIAKSSASLLLRNVQISESAGKVLLEKRLNSLTKATSVLYNNRELLQRQLKQKANEIVSHAIYDKNTKIIFLSLLFWTEGAKKTSDLRFTNSDGRMVSLFLSLLRETFILDEHKLHVTLHLHEYHNEEKAKRFWSELTKIPTDQFHKTYIKPHTGVNKREGYKGCVTVYYYNSAVARTLAYVYNTLASNIINQFRGVG